MNLTKDGSLRHHGGPNGSGYMRPRAYRCKGAGQKPIFYAWCFSHGRLHTFDGAPWCTATWTRLTGTTEAEALADKQARYGDAQFLHQLTGEQQLDLITNRDPE
jgi:hypothetical protein